MQRTHALGLLAAAGIIGSIGAAACGGSDTTNTVYVDGGTQTQIVEVEAGAATRRSAIDVEVTTAENTPVAIDLKTTDGTKPATFKIVKAPSHGTASAIGADGKVTFTPATNFAGIDFFRVATTDDVGDGPTATVWITVTPVNQVPVGSAMTVTAYPGATIPIDLAASDVDSDANALTFALGTQPTKGTATLAGNRVSYTAGASATGADSLTFTANDGVGTSAPTTITINIVTPKDCQELRAAGVSKNKVYTIDPDGAGGNPAFPAYCEMERSGGGWTLAMKVDGSSTQFQYSAPAWTDTSVVNDAAADLDTLEAKLPSFNTMALTEVMVGMLPLGSFDAGLVDAGDGGIAAQAWRFVTLPVTAPSLKDLFSGGYTPTWAGRAAWKGLVPDSSLQINCNREGFNVPNGGIAGAQLRVGIIGNNENDCGSPDSILGVGRQAGVLCNAALPSTYTAGNYVVCGGEDNGDRRIQTYSAIFVRSRAGGDFTSLAPEASCKAHLAKGHTLSGRYLVKAVQGDAGADAGGPITAYCDMTTEGGGWTLGYVTNTALNAQRGGFGASLLATDLIGTPPSARSVDPTPVAASLDLNAFPYTELELTAYYVGMERYRSASIARSDLRIAFGQDGYYLYGDKNGYYWCGGVHAYTDLGTGEVNTPPGAPSKCKNHGSLYDGWDFSQANIANQGLTLGGTNVFMSGGWFAAGAPALGYGGSNGAQAIWVR